MEQQVIEHVIWLEDDVTEAEADAVLYHYRNYGLSDTSHVHAVAKYGAVRFETEYDRQTFTQSELDARWEEAKAQAAWECLPRKEKRRPLIAFHANKRRAARKNRTPPWANLDAIRELYDRAAWLTRRTKKPHHVDHIIPLQGKRVSGLHVAENLRVVPAAENARKYNHFEVA